MSGPTKAQRAVFGPQEVGGRYHNGYWNKAYTVTGMRTVDGFTSMTVEWDDGRTTTHCTAWDPKRDGILPPLPPDPFDRDLTGNVEPWARTTPFVPFD